MALSVLYRGPLSSCNYDCHYCPFAKHHETSAELRRDREAR
jgi:biotin synthase-like enzyme